MSVFGSTTWTIHIWMTAAMTLVAGIPCTDCICPDGTRKTFCSGQSAKDTSCCAAAAEAKSQGGKSCCAGKKAARCAKNAGQTTPANDTKVALAPPQRPDQKPGPDGRVGAKGCSRVMADSRIPVLTPAEQTGTGSMVAAVLAPVSSLAVPILTEAPACAAGWQSCRLPPPTDLVITLQHLVI
jgi:hypothetical protein